MRQPWSARHSSVPARAVRHAFIADRIAVSESVLAELIELPEQFRPQVQIEKALELRPGKHIAKEAPRASNRPNG